MQYQRRFTIFKIRMKFKAYEKIVSLIEHAREAKDTLKSEQEQTKSSH